jgi:hypothetical protein
MAAKKKKGDFIVCRIRHSNSNDIRFGTVDVFVAFPGHYSVFLYSIVLAAGQLEAVQVYPCHDLRIESVSDLMADIQSKAIELGADVIVTCKERVTFGQVQAMVVEDFKPTIDTVRALADLVGCFSSVAA